MGEAERPRTGAEPGVGVAGRGGDIGVGGAH